MSRKRWVAVLALGLVCGVARQVRAQEHIGDFTTCKNSFTEDQEIAEGRKVADQVFQQMPVLKDSDPVSVYVRNLGMKLTKSAPGYSWPYNFHVVDSDEINAFALPGGAVFVNLATITAAESEAQLAGVMGHEISHVVLRHSTCNITKQKSRAACSPASVRSRRSRHLAITATLRRRESATWQGSDS